MIRSMEMKDSQVTDEFDFIVIGGGLAGCLTTHLVKDLFPQSRILLVEKSQNLCGNHTWSFHESDIPSSLRSLIQPLTSHSWQSYSVHFPQYSRDLPDAYYSIKSKDLAEKTLKLKGSSVEISLGKAVNYFDAHTVHLEGRILRAKWVVQCTGWSSLSGPLGYQKFLGLELEFSSPHGLKAPIIKDARLPQTDGYRFMYALPFSERHLLLEDTYYSNNDKLSLDDWEVAIHQYAANNFHSNYKVIHREVGCLPLILKNQKTQTTEPTDGVIKVGPCSGFYHPVTGYSLPQTFATLDHLALALKKQQTYSEALVSQNQFLKKQESSQNFLLLLNRMLFLAAEPQKRYVILQRFYRLPASLIHRFYQGSPTLGDRLSILLGKPPVSIWRALKAIFF